LVGTGGRNIVRIKRIFSVTGEKKHGASGLSVRGEHRMDRTGLDILQDTCNFFGSGLDLDIYF